MNAPNATSTRPYLIRALYEWCTDNGFTPYVAVSVDNTVQVPREYVKNNEIVLNIGFDATSSLTLGNEFIEFKARFGGSAREILVPISHVIAIYARENGQGMAFPLEAPFGGSTDEANDAQAISPEDVPVAEEFPSTQVAMDAPESKIMQLVEKMPADDASAAKTRKKSTSTEPPKPPTRPRPALKRVK